MKNHTAPKRNLRKVVAEEWDRLGRSDAVFMEHYPETAMTLRKLVAAIRRRHGRQRNSKNGTPEEREARARQPSISEDSG
ncbi:hypothetical protein HGRIS_001226 [Hohenbuehelia grisea]|uniref:Uncharacterized protein n=1 Tax=Hohenbuehelia grisea TaxID=104357 RepID=A0ABR3JP86_9AGAR